MTKVLILKECCLGDMLMLSSAVAQLQQLHPEIYIDVACEGFARDVPKHWPFLRKVHAYPRFWGSRRLPLKQWWGLINQLRLETYDVIFVCDVGRGAQALAALIGGKQRFGFVHAGRRIALTAAIKRSPDDGIPELEAYEKLFALWTGTLLDQHQYFYQLSAEELAWAGQWLLQQNLEAKRFVVLAPGGGKNPGTDMPRKRWPSARFAEVCAQLSQTHRVIVVGTHDEQALISEVIGTSSAIVCVGVTLGRVGALLQEAAAVLCNDSVLMHLAAAVKTPTLALFGPTDPYRLLPPFPWVQHIWEPVECSPCYQQILGTFPPCPRYRCQEGIAVGQVLDKLRGLVQSGNPNAPSP